MKKHLGFLFLLLLVFPVCTKAFDDPHYYFYKTDEQGNNISDAEFKLKSIDGSVEYNVWYDSDEHIYKYNEYIDEEYDKAINLVPNNIRDILNSFTKYEDFVPYIHTDQEVGTITDYNDIVVECEFSENASVNNNESNYNIKRTLFDGYYSTCYATVSTVLFLEETKTPKGYEKEKAITTAKVTYLFHLDQDTEMVTSRNVEVNFKNILEFKVDNTFNFLFDQLYKYDDNLNYNNIEEVYNTIIDYGADMKYEMTACGLEFSAPKIQKQSTINVYPIKKMDNSLEFGDKQCTPIIIDKRGTSLLSISNYVNSEEEIDIEETSTVQIKVHLKNDGKAPSYDNVVISKVPDGVEYVENSATDNGVYSEEDKTVTWNFAYLDAKDGYMFAYDVIVPTGSKSSVYVTSSSVTADDTNTPIESNEARVLTPGTGGSDEEIVNPKTGDIRDTILVILLLISIGILSYSISTKSFKL